MAPVPRCSDILPFRGVVLDLLDVEFVFDGAEDGKVRGGRVSQGFTDEPFARHQDDGERR